MRLNEKRKQENKKLSMGSAREKKGGLFFPSLYFFYREALLDSVAA
jgi:hypothetical protein